MWHWDGHMGWGWMGLGWIVFLVLIGVAIWFAVTAGRRDGMGPRPGSSAEDEVKRRYARGEIDRETYQRMMDDLRR